MLQMEIATTFSPAQGEASVSVPGPFEREDWAVRFLPSDALRTMDSWRFLDSWPSKVRLVEAVAFGGAVAGAVLWAALQGSA